MRIGIEATRVRVPGTGIDRHVRSLLGSLGTVDTSNEYLLFSDDRSLAEKMSLPGNFRVEPPRKRFRMIRRRGVGGIGRFLFRDIDVFHFPNSDVWYSKYAKTVVTLHDLAQLQFPGNFFDSQKGLAAFKKKLSFVKRNADTIIAVSEYAKGDISRRLGIPGEKIEVVHNGIDRIFVKTELDERGLRRMEEKFRIRRPFILFVGGLDFRKNLGALLKAFDILAGRGLPHTVVVVGADLRMGASLHGKSSPATRGRDPATESVHPRTCAGYFGQGVSVPVEEALKNVANRNRVAFVSSVNDDDLVTLYNAADMLVHPSVCEGFGFPPLEAMACGTPAVVSSRASLPEVVGDAAVLIDPDDPVSFADALFEVATVEEKRRCLIEKGLERARKFSQDVFARKVIGVYERLAKGG